MDKVALMRAVKSQPERWEKGFGFLQRKNIEELAPGRYLLDSLDVYAIIQKTATKLLGLPVGNRIENMQIYNTF